MYSDYTAAFVTTKLETLELKALVMDVNHVVIFSISSELTCTCRDVPRMI